MVVNDLCILPTAMNSLVSEWRDTMLKTRTTTYVYMKRQSLILSVCDSIFIGFGVHNTKFVVNESVAYLCVGSINNK
jgi:hypothetical protein